MEFYKLLQSQWHISISLSRTRGRIEEKKTCPLNLGAGVSPVIVKPTQITAIIKNYIIKPQVGGQEDKN